MLSGPHENQARHDVIVIVAAVLVILISLALQGCDAGGEPECAEAPAPSAMAPWSHEEAATPAEPSASPVLSVSPHGATAAPPQSPAVAPYPPLALEEKEWVEGVPHGMNNIDCTAGVDCNALYGPAPACQAWLCTRGGACSAIPATVLETCNGEDDDCDGAVDEGTCQDVGPCVIGVCLGADGCVYTLADDGASCDDGDPLTEGDQCDQGACVGD